MPNEKMLNGKKCRKDKTLNGTKVRIDIMSKIFYHSTFCPNWPFLLSTLFLFGVLSHSTFFPLWRFFHWTFFSIRCFCPFRHFFHSTFCPIPRFVFWRFVVLRFFYFRRFLLQHFVGEPYPPPSTLDLPDVWRELQILSPEIDPSVHSVAVMRSCDTLVLTSSSSSSATSSPFFVLPYPYPWLSRVVFQPPLECL